MSRDFQVLPCNCRNKKACAYDGKCRTPIVVYKATCLQTGKHYIGNTQQFVKKRIQQHVGDVKRLVTKGRRSDSFAEHFAELVPVGTTPKEIRNHVKVKIDILWKGDPLTCVKTFGSKKCRLCAKERLAILLSSRNEPEKTINKCKEIYGACRHKPRFHKLQQKESPTSTDESAKDERGLGHQNSDYTTEPNLKCSGSQSDRREPTLMAFDELAGSPTFRTYNNLKAREDIAAEGLPDSGIEEVYHECDTHTSDYGA